MEDTVIINLNRAKKVNVTDDTRKEMDAIKSMVKGDLLSAIQKILTNGGRSTMFRINGRPVSVRINTHLLVSGMYENTMTVYFGWRVGNPEIVANTIAEIVSERFGCMSGGSCWLTGSTTSVLVWW